MIKENTILVYGNSLEALDDGTILINNKKPETLEDFERALNVLIKATISFVK